MARRFGSPCAVLYSVVVVEVRRRPRAQVILAAHAAVGLVLVAAVRVERDRVAVAHEGVRARAAVAAVHGVVDVVAVMAEVVADQRVQTRVLLAVGQIEVVEFQEEAQVVVPVVRWLIVWHAAAAHRVLVPGCAEEHHQLRNGIH